ncbi:MAG TPA: carboxypeptidase-like regulatory domain-containing protein, partial [Acidobacteriota bacterium]|nr:carboxypeptidase-like regulatory domain-containing protein [Acidobacteriota bacterium]
MTRRSTWRVWVLPAILLWAFEGAGFGTVVEGVLRGVDGRPAAGVAFYFTDQGGNLVGTVVTDLSGAFRVAVDPGSYEIRTSLDRSAGPLAELAVGRRPTLRMDLQLPDGSGAAPPEPREEQSSAADSERALETIGDL